VLISGSIYDQIKNKIDIEFENLGTQSLKNIAEPVRAYRALTTTIPFAPSRGPDSSKPSIAVLPFQNMSGDPDQEYFSDGITEDIITELSRFRDLAVIARNSSFAYKGKPTKIQAIARDLGVEYVLEGSVRKAGQRIRITAQLINAGNGR